MDFDELKIFLDEKSDQYNNSSFIENDPIQIPHQFSKKQDIEISAFLTATISWGNRKSIIKSANQMMAYLDNEPFDFVMNFRNSDLKYLERKAVHRTFNSEDFIFFLKQFQRIYGERESLENVFLLQENETNFYHSIERFRTLFLNNEEYRSKKHISSPYKNSAAKRIMMFLRWMIRKDKKGVDFGIWENIDQKFLSIPLDVHTGNISRELQLIERKQNDWKTVEELDSVLRKLNKKDPAKYDFALFGLGINKYF